MKNKYPTIQMIVKNEDQWIWYAISSVYHYASKIIIFDTGSKDRTLDIINTFPKEKIIFKEKGLVTSDQISLLRQEQLELTDTDWFLIVDGDEVWPDSSIKTVCETISQTTENYQGVVVKSRICLGDVYHCQDEIAGKYQIGPWKGHINIRAYRKNKYWKWGGVYPNEAYCDENGAKIQEKGDKLIFLNTYYWHLRHLPRSTIFPNTKIKFEVGFRVNESELPEVFKKKRPQIVPSPWIRYSAIQQVFAYCATPFSYLKRRLL